MNDVKKGSGLIWRMIVTVGVLLTYWGGNAIYKAYEAPFVGSLATNQVNDNATDYAVQHAITSEGVMDFTFWILVIVLAAVWVSFIVKKWRSGTTMMATLMGCILIIGAGTSACRKPPEVKPLKEIAPNETCYLVPMTGASLADQKEFMSVNFLNARKIASKRVEIPVVEHKIGRWDYEIEWVPAMKVICVDRTPVTREWTKTDKTGTTVSDQAIAVESIESINFKLGITTTAVITEEDAAAFQYWFAGKSLAQIMDENVRGFVLSFLAREFGQITLDEARVKKAEIFMKLTEAVKTEFKDKGITVTNIGSSEGFAYDDPSVQDSINKAWTAKRDRERAEVERETELIKADKDAKAVLIRAEGIAKANRAVQDSLTGAIIKLRQIERWDGHLPKVTGSGILPMIDLKD